MAVISTGLLTKGLRSEFFERLAAREATTWYDKLATRIPSTSDSETYKFLGSVPAMREWGTGREAKGLLTESYSVENLKYEATLEVDRDELSDDQTGQIAIRVGEMAERAATHKDYLIAQLLLNGTTAGYNSYDGVPFFDASHSVGSSGSQANEGSFAVASYAGANLFDEPASTTLYGPQTALAAYDVAVAALMRLKDDRGDYMHRTPSGFAVACHYSKWSTFRKAFGAQLLPQLGSNILTPDAAPIVIPMPEITNAAIWYLLKTDGVIKPFIFQDREPIEFTSQDKGSSEEFHKEKYYYGARARYRMTYGYWQFAYATTMV